MRRVIVTTLVGLLLPMALAHPKGLREDNPQMFEMVRNAVLPLFQAMKEGDTAVIEQHLDGRTHDEYQVLFEQNRTYGDFLREYYADASFTLNDVSRLSSGIYVANVSIEWANGRKAEVELEVSPAPFTSGEAAGKWREEAGSKWRVGGPVERSAESEKRAVPDID